MKMTFSKGGKWFCGALTYLKEFFRVNSNILIPLLNVQKVCFYSVREFCAQPSG